MFRSSPNVGEVWPGTMHSDIRVGAVIICMALWTIISHAKLVLCLPLKIITTITHSPKVQHGRWKQRTSIKKGISCCKWSLSVDFEGGQLKWYVSHDIRSLHSLSLPLLSLGVLNTVDDPSMTITPPTQRTRQKKKTFEKALLRETNGY